MITAAEPEPFGKRALALSVALHGCVLGLLAVLVPAAQATVGGRGAEEAPCSTPCSQVFTLRIEHRARAPILAAAPHFAPVEHTLRPRLKVAHKERITSYASTRERASLRDSAAHSAPVRTVAATIREGALQTVAPAPQLATTSVQAGTTTDVTIAPQTHDDTVKQTVPDAQANRGMGPANWGSGFGNPTLRDRALYDEIVAKLGRRGSITITVDDQGRATDVRIAATGLDNALLDDLRRRLLAARYVPVEHDGIAFEGTLQIRATP